MKTKTKCIITNKEGIRYVHIFPLTVSKVQILFGLGETDTLFWNILHKPALRFIQGDCL